jgi:hypothetical protein
MLLTLRDRRKRVQYPRYTTTKTPRQKKPKLEHNDEEATFKVDDPKLGQFTAKFKVPRGRTWQSFGEPSTGNVKGFVWANWEEEGGAIVYKLEQRGEHVLIACFPWALDRKETGFMNEVVLDTSTNGIHIVAKEILKGSVPVYEWDNVHRIHNNVGDHYFYCMPRRKSCSRDGCPNPVLNANSAYLVCANDSCLRVYHARCLDDQALQYQGEAVCTIDGKQLACPNPECNTLFRCRASGATQDQTPMPKEPNIPKFTVIADIGTSRVKVIGIVKNEEKTAPEGTVMPSPKCFIDPHNLNMYFEERRSKQNLTLIEPIKKLMTGNQLDVDQLSKLGLSENDIFKRFFKEVAEWMRQSYLGSIPHLDSAQITFAVACLAGLSTQRQNIMLNAIFACAKNVIPVLLNEAEMGYIGSTHNSPLPQGSKVLMVDIGGFTTVSTLDSTGRV